MRSYVSMLVRTSDFMLKTPSFTDSIMSSQMYMCIPEKSIIQSNAYYRTNIVVCDSNETNNCNRKNNLILIMTPEKQDKTLELSKHWSTPARNEVIMKTTYPVNQ